MTAVERMSDPFGIETGNLFEYWLSLWPVAPWFGVEWRFAPMFLPEPAVDEAAFEETEEQASAGAVANVTVIDTAVPADPGSVAATPARPAALLDAVPSAPDDLKLIKGIGPKLERQLNDLGVYTFAQIAGFCAGDLAWIDDHLTAFKGRCFRDDWVGQAQAHLA